MVALNEKWNRTGYGNPDLIHLLSRGNCVRHGHYDFCGPVLVQAARVDYEGKSLSDVMNEALCSGFCKFDPWRTRNPCRTRNEEADRG